MYLLDKTCTAYFFDFRADSDIFVICSNSVEQSRFWCRAVFSSRWISSRWPFSDGRCCLKTIILIKTKNSWQGKGANNFLRFKSLKILTNLAICIYIRQCDLKLQPYFKMFFSNEGVKMIYHNANLTDRKKLNLA